MPVLFNPRFLAGVLLASRCLAANDSGAAKAVAEVAKSDSPAAITTIAEAFARWPDLTIDDQSVRFEGVVTGVMPSGAFRLNDGELGIYVTRSATGQNLTAGERVAVTGVLRKGGFSPWMTPHDLTRLGPGELPEARPVSYNVLASGAADNQWVEIEGVVRSVQVLETRDFVGLDLGMDGGNLRVLVTRTDPAPFESLVDAAVRVRGVAAVNVDAHKRVVEPTFRVSSFSDITVLRAGQPDAFAQPIVPVNRLMRLSSLGGPLRHRVRTRAIVTRQISDTTLFVRDGDVGLKVELTSARTFQPGEVVEAAGFPMMMDGIAVLQHAICRSVGMTAPPASTHPTLNSMLAGKHNADLVTLRARLVDSVIEGQRATLIFQAGDHLFKGLLNLPSAKPTPLPAKNSLVSVTGICVINELEEAWFYRPRSFLLVVADSADLKLVRAPSWWTPSRLWGALAVTGLVLLAATGWVRALRRQIDRKRAVIEQQARHAAALEERSRIARELHDTLEQGLTGLSLQMKALETDLAGTSQPVQSRLQFARQMLRQSRALARNAIRELRAETVPGRLEGLLDGLKRVAGSWNHSGALTVTIDVQGQVRRLAPRVENHLLGIGTEAITNAVKHGRAESIHVGLDYRSTEISMSVKDDGVGFEPDQHLEQASGCFGLLGMRERVREVSGAIQILSQPGQGTEVIVNAPVDPALETNAAATRHEVERLDPKPLVREPANVMNRLEVKPLHLNPNSPA